MICIKMILTRHLDRVVVKLKMFLSISRIVGKFSNALISLFHVQAKSLLRIVFLHNFCKMNNEQFASGKIMHPHLNLNDLRVSRKPTTEKASRLAAIAIQHAIYEKWFRFYFK